MPELKRIFDDIKLGTAVPTPPVLSVQAVHDRIVSVDDIDELVDAYESGGASVTYHRDMFSEHMLLHPLSAPMALRWLIDRFAGKPLEREPGPDQMADAAEPDDLHGHGAACADCGEGRYGADGRTPSTVTGAAGIAG